MYCPFNGLETDSRAHAASQHAMTEIGCGPVNMNIPGHSVQRVLINPDIPVDRPVCNDHIVPGQGLMRFRENIFLTDQHHNGYQRNHRCLMANTRSIDTKYGGRQNCLF